MFFSYHSSFTHYIQTPWGWLLLVMLRSWLSSPCGIIFFPNPRCMAHSPLLVLKIIRLVYPPTPPLFSFSLPTPPQTLPLVLCPPLTHTSTRISTRIPHHHIHFNPSPSPLHTHSSPLHKVWPAVRLSSAVASIRAISRALCRFSDQKSSNWR